MLTTLDFPIITGPYRIIIVLLMLTLWSVSLNATDLSCQTIDVYVREGCPHCADAREFLNDLSQRYPDLNISLHEVSTNAQALYQLLELSKQHGIEQPGVPSFLVCDAFYVGFSEAAGSAEWIKNQLIDPEPTLSLNQIDTPFGTFSADNLGLPLFTVVLGLVDGFNPCAMWVLLFLLSILVNIRNRRRIILIAGTFVLVSGIVYFVFMATWLNLFLFIGFVRWLQIAIGLLALIIGAVHIKDFFALGKGISLSIRDSFKPTLYMRVRNVLHAESLWAALVGVIFVAVMVNIIELLCTAGLPALYTQMLTLRPMSTPHYYGYLLLYNLAYIFDDTLMVAIAVITMDKLKLQERQGRWLKLFSGLVVTTLGLVLLFAPEIMI